MAEFGDRVNAFFDELFGLFPTAATAAGMHEHDGEWPDVGTSGRQARTAFVDRWQAELGSIDPAGLSLDDRIDRELLLAELDGLRFEDAELQEDTWDPLSYVYLLGGGIFPLLAREFAPLERRLASVAARFDAMPRLLADARTRLSDPAGRTPSRLHTEMAIRQLGGIGGLGDEAIAEGEAAADQPGVRPVLPRLRESVDRARRALDEFHDFLEADVLSRSSGEGRLGRDLFARKLRHTFKTDLTADEIVAQAEREFLAVRGEMIRIARSIWSQWVPDEELPTAAHDGSQDAADQRTVRQVLAAIGRVHQKPADLLDFCRAEHSRIVEFCTKNGVIDVPDEPLEIIWTPPFLREAAGAMLDSPGPLDKGQKTFFCITPTPEDWSDAQVDSYLAEDNDRMLQLLTIHEATPGHYLQGVYGNRCPSLARAVFWSGVFAEGWAVYVTQVMIDCGYGADDPALLLTHWKFYLRAVTNALMDVKIHTGSMTEAEAMELMVNGGFQEESEARKKWDRARLTSTQLSTYFVGSVEMWNLERERRRRAALAAGDSRGDAAVPEPRIVGGFGQTPGFDYKAHLEDVISHGMPPIPLLRELLFAE